MSQRKYLPAKVQKYKIMKDRNSSVYDLQMTYEEAVKILRSVHGRRLVLNMADENAQEFEDYMLWLHQNIINKNS